MFSLEKLNQKFSWNRLHPTYNDVGYRNVINIYKNIINILGSSPTSKKFGHQSISLTSVETKHFETKKKTKILAR